MLGLFFYIHRFVYVEIFYLKSWNQDITFFFLTWEMQKLFRPYYIPFFQKKEKKRVWKRGCYSEWGKHLTQNGVVGKLVMWRNLYNTTEPDPAGNGPIASLFFGQLPELPATSLLNLLHNPSLPPFIQRTLTAPNET